MMLLGHKCAYLDSNKGYLMAVTVKGILHVWYDLRLLRDCTFPYNSYRNMKTLSASHPPVSLSPLFLSVEGSPSPNIRVSSIFIRPNGAVVVSLSSGGVYTYDNSLLNWVCLSDNWWSSGSDAWNARTRTSTSAAQGVLAGIEASVAEAAMTMPNPNADPSVERPAWWNTALTLGHLESRLHACRLLDSASEYKQALLLYVKKIADEGFRGKAEDVLKEYCGPLYWFVKEHLSFRLASHSRSQAPGKRRKMVFDCMWAIEKGSVERHIRHSWCVPRYGYCQLN